MANKNKQAAVKTTVVVSGKVKKAIEDVRQYHPHVKVAYFNADGEYHFHKRKGFTAVTIIEEDEVEQDMEVEDDEPVLKPDRLEF